MGKKAWCLEQGNSGCPLPVPTALQNVRTTVAARIDKPYDCNAGFSNCAKGWSASKKAWCLKYHRGCPLPSALYLLTGKSDVHQKQTLGMLLPSRSISVILTAAFLSLLGVLHSLRPCIRPAPCTDKDTRMRRI